MSEEDAIGTVEQIPPATLIVALAKKRGGVDVRVLQLARALDVSGSPYAIAVLTGSMLQKALEAEKLSVLPLSRTRLSPLVPMDLVRGMRQMGIQVIDAHNSQSQAWAAIAAALHRTPGRIATIHSNYRDEHPNFFRQFLHESGLLACRWAGFEFVTVSSSVERYAREILRLPERRLRTIINGIQVMDTPPEPVDLGDEPPWPKEAFVLTIVGRLVPVKGHRYLIDAVAKVRGSLERPVCLAIVGSGPEESALRDQVRILNLEDRVGFLGFRNDVAQIMASSHLLCLPSISEGMPYVLLESAQQGVPCLSSPLDGILEFFEDGKTIFLAPVGDVGAIAKQIEDLAREPERARTVGLAAKDLVSRELSVQAMTDAMFSAYGAAVHKRS